MIRFVVRRVGGLEGQGRGSLSGPRVVRRVGGLEVPEMGFSPIESVVRRVGGLEEACPRSAACR